MLINSKTLQSSVGVTVKYLGPSPFWARRLFSHGSIKLRPSRQASSDANVFKHLTVIGSWSFPAQQVKTFVAVIQELAFSASASPQVRQALRSLFCHHDRQPFDSCGSSCELRRNCHAIIYRVRRKRLKQAYSSTWGRKQCRTAA